MNDDPRITAAERRVETARTRLFDNLATLKRRLMPGTIARNVAHDLADKGQDAARSGVRFAKARPGLAAAAAALAALLLARRPLTRVLFDDEPETRARSARSARDRRLTKGR